MARLNRIPFDIWIQYSQRRMILWLFCLRNLERRFPPGANWVTILRGEDSTIPYRGRRFLWRNWCIAFISSIKSCRAPISTLSPNFKFKNKLNNYKLKVLDNYAFLFIDLESFNGNWDFGVSWRPISGVYDAKRSIAQFVADFDGTFVNQSATLVDAFVGWVQYVQIWQTFAILQF